MQRQKQKMGHNRIARRRSGRVTEPTQLEAVGQDDVSEVLSKEKYSMAKQTSKDQLLKDIHTERRRLEKNLSVLRAEDMIQPDVIGTWSVKDILAHLVAWERLFMDWYFAGVHADTPGTMPVGMSQKSINALNQQIYEKNQGRSLDDILAEFHISYQEIMTLIEAIPEEDMFIHGRFPWTGTLTLADYITGNTCNHYAWAKSQIRKRVRRAANEPRRSHNVENHAG